MHAEGRGDALRDARQAFLDRRLVLVAQPARGALQRDARGDLVLRLAALDHRDAHHPARQRVEVARHDGLDRHDRMPRRDHGVAREVRQRRVPGMAVEDDLEARARRHHGAVMHGDGPRRQARPVVPAEDALHREALEQPVGDHVARAAAAFLGRLEDQPHRAGPVRVVQQHARRAQQRRGVPVMAAGMHHARHGRLPGQVLVLLLDGQRIHVPAQAHGPVAAAAPQRGDDTVPAHARGDVGHAHLLQPGDDEGRSIAFMEGQSRVRVQMTPPGCKGRGKIGAHDSTTLSRRFAQHHRPRPACRSDDAAAGLAGGGPG